MIDYTKPVQTVSSEPVEIITTKGRGLYPVLFYVGAAYILRDATLDGKSRYPENDLINAAEKPKTIVRYVILYDDESIRIAKNRSDRGINSIACKRVEFTEGEYD